MATPISMCQPMPAARFPSNILERMQAIMNAKAADQDARDARCMPCLSTIQVVSWCVALSRSQSIITLHIILLFVYHQNSFCSMFDLLWKSDSACIGAFNYATSRLTLQARPRKKEKESVSLGTLIIKLKCIVS